MTSKRMTPEVAKGLSIAEQHEWFQRQRSRRALLKGGLTGANAMLLGPTLLESISGASTASLRSAAPAPTVLINGDKVNGSTYLAVGGAGKSLYSFSAPDSYEGNIDNVASVVGYVNESGETTQNETVTWSQVRYTGYKLLVVDVTPPSFGGTTTMLVRAVNEFGTEIDRFTLSRRA